MTKCRIALVGLFLFLPTLSIAAESISAECEGQATIVAQVLERKTNSLSYCLAMLDPKSIEFYATNKSCPLPLTAVLSQGIRMPLEDGHDCNVYAGDVIDGLLELRHGQIYLK